MRSSINRRLLLARIRGSVRPTCGHRECCRSCGCRYVFYGFDVRTLLGS